MSASCIIRLDNRLEELQRFDTAFNEFARMQNFSQEVTYAIQLSIDELFVNIVSYGFEDDDDTRHEIEVRIKVFEDRVQIDLIDDAKPFNPLTEANEPDLDATLEDRRIGGVGIHIVKSMMNDVSYSRMNNKNCLRMVKSLDR